MASGFFTGKSGWIHGLLLAALLLLINGQWIPFQLEFAATAVEGLELPEADIALFDRAASFQRAREWGGLSRQLALIPLLILVLRSRLGEAVEVRFGATRVRWQVRILFLVGVFILIWLTSMPYGFASFIERQALGLTPMTLADRLRYMVISRMLPLVLFVLKGLMLYCFLALFGRRWWLPTALLMVLVFTFIPEYLSLDRPLDPIAELTRLEDGEKRAAMEQVAESTGADLDYYVIDHSKRSRMVNMALTGRLDREYVLITDTLLEMLGPRELAVILAHELGHHVTRRLTVISSKVTGLLSSILVFWVVAVIYRRKAIADPHRLQAIVYTLLIGALFIWPTRPFTCLVNRIQEREADRYALEVTGDREGLKSALIATSKANYASIDMPGWAYVLGASHPTLRQRLAFVDAWKPE